MYIRQLPVYRRFTDGCEPVVDLREGTAAEESPMSRERTGVSGLYDHVLPAGYHVLFLPGRRSPKDEGDWFLPLVQQGDYLVGELLPAAATMRVRLMGSDGKHRIEQQHALASDSRYPAWCSQGQWPAP